jgi:hypothetical protein
MPTPKRSAIRPVKPDLKTGQCFRLSIGPKRTCHAGQQLLQAKKIPVLPVGKTGNDTGRTALIIIELRHGFQLILGGVKDRMVRIPLLA